MFAKFLKNNDLQKYIFVKGKIFEKINDLKVISTLIKVKAISVNCIFLSCHIAVSE